MNGSDQIDLGGDALAAAVSWIAHALTGQIATALAILAVAGLGYTLLTGRVPFRRAGAILLGCWIILGAVPIASALLDISAEAAAPLDRMQAVMPPVLIAEPLAGSDPYASASVSTATDQITDPFRQ